MLSTVNKFELTEYEYVTPTVTSDDPRMLRAIDGCLGLYEACYVIGRGFDDGRHVPNPSSPHPTHLLAALLSSIEALNQWNGKWVLGGGLAMNYHGRERASNLITFWLFEDKKQLGPVLDELDRYGVRRHSIDQPSFLPPDNELWWKPLQFGLPEEAPVDVDLLVASHVFMAFAYASGVESSINGVRVRMVGREALMILKMRAYRDRDKADLQDLLRAKPPFDRELVLAWLRKFKIAHRLAEMEALASENGGRRMG